MESRNMEMTIVDITCGFCSERQWKRILLRASWTICNKCGNLIDFANTKHDSKDRSNNTKSISTNNCNSFEEKDLLDEDEIDDCIIDLNNSEYEQKTELLNQFPVYEGGNMKNNIFEKQFQGFTNQTGQKQRNTLLFPSRKQGKFRNYRISDSLDWDDDVDLEMEIFLNSTLTRDASEEYGKNKTTTSNTNNHHQHNDSSSLWYLSDFAKTMFNIPKPPKKITKKILLNTNSKTKEVGVFEPLLCCICLLTMKEKCSIAEWKCKHIFHYECLSKWIETKEVCPVCRGTID